MPSALRGAGLLVLALSLILPAFADDDQKDKADEKKRAAKTDDKKDKDAPKQEAKKDENQKVELQAADDLKVRTLLLPVEYDDAGKVRKLSDKELRELRGPDPKLPGYAADFDSLKPEQIVDIYVAPPKGGAAKAKAKP